MAATDTETDTAGVWPLKTMRVAEQIEYRFGAY
jgi:hypothetical protein